MVRTKFHLGLRKILAMVFIILVLNLQFFFNCNDLTAQPIPMKKTDNIKEIAQFDDNYGLFRDITGENDIIVVTSDDRLYFFNVSNTNNPFIKTEIPFYGINDVIIKNNLLYIIQNNQFIIYSLENNSLLMHDTITFSTQCSKITIYENYAYLTLVGGNISIVNITLPNSLKLESNFHIEGTIRDFSVFDNHLYILNSSSGAIVQNSIVVQNVTDKVNPATVSMFNLGIGSDYSLMKISNGYLYMVNSTGKQLNVYNCSLPTIFDLITTCSDCSGSSIALQDNLLLLAGYLNFQIINITTAEKPVKIAEKELLNGFAWEIYVKSNSAFVIEFFKGITIIDITNSSEPTKTTHIDSGGYSYDLLLLDSKLLVCDGYNVEVLTLNENDELSKITHFREENEEAYNYYKIHAIDDLLYISTRTQDLLILEILENNSLVKIAKYHDSQSSLNEMVSNERYLFANAGNGIVVLDIINPYNPININFYFDGSTIHDLAIKGNRLFTLYSRGLEDQGLRIYDVSNPNEWQLLSGFQLVDCNLCNGARITLHGNYLVTAYDEQVLFLDVTNPAQTVKVSKYDKENLLVTNLESKGNYICIGMTGTYLDGGVSIIDVSNIANPTEIAYYYDGGIAQSILIEENRLFIADGLDGLEVLETTFQFEKNNENVLRNYLILTGAVLLIIGISIGVTVYSKKKRRM
ncbi:MAG: hypothetical protein JXA54_07525 [Candidatus Heimdallarchaeota archaeon]|nr:hypothetical protein [Candidatus Heimdallarchaeota archaeon]